MTSLGDLNEGTWDDLNVDLLPYENSTKYGLLDGNIAWITTDIKKLSPTGSEGIQSIAYEYDQLHRIRQGKSYKVVNDIDLTKKNSATNYDTRYTYNPDGNIDTLIRYGGQGIMDSLYYHYDYQDAQPNLLHQVSDAVSTSAYPDDLDDQGANNYLYDPSGNITQDLQASITIDWDPYETNMNFIKHKFHTEFCLIKFM